MDEQTATVKAKRVVYLDLIKLLSAIMVTFFHFGRLSFGFTAGTPYVPNVNRIVMNLCTMAVPLFFMVNGALLFNKTYSIKKMYLRALKILILIIVWKFTHFPFWFFRTLIVLYLLYPFLKWLYDEHRKLLYCLMAAVFVMPFMYNASLVVFKQFFPDFSINVFSHKIVFSSLRTTTVFTAYSILYFTLGAFCYKKKFPTWLSAVLFVIGWAFCTYEGVVYTNFENTLFSSVENCYQSIGCLFMTFGLFNMLKAIDGKITPKVQQIIVLLSANVLSIYLFHPLIIKAFVKLLSFPEIGNIGINLLMALAIDLVCVIIGTIMSKIPYVRWLIKI